jgi:serine/threonine-protein phosphatase 4 regulatory subunit 1
VHLSLSLSTHTHTNTHTHTHVVQEEQEEQRMTAMKLMGELSFTLGPETVKNQVSPQVVTLAGDTILRVRHLLECVLLLESVLSTQVVTLAGDAMFRVRKATALHIGKICRWVPRDFAVDKILPVYLTLAEDEIWGVRKACAESIAAVAAALAADVRKTTILPLFDKLATDVSRWVRNAAFQHLGPLIATLSAAEVTPKLLQYFASMATGKGQAGNNDNELPTFCAYNFPAVVLTVGKDNWVHLEEAYTELLKDIQWKVRRTLSYSLHEIALILGPKLTQDSLLPALDTFLKDLDEVKVGVVQNLAKLLGVIEPAARQQYVPLLINLEMESDNWRFRHLLAIQLGELFHLYDEEVIQTELYPIFMKLCRDPVAEVRNGSGLQLHAILKRLDELKVSWRPEFVEELQDLATDRLFQHRLIYAQMCITVLQTIKESEENKAPESANDIEMFKTDLLPHLLVLAEDRVGNIRQRAGISLQLLKEIKGFKNDAKVATALAALTKDKDVEVLRSMGQKLQVGLTSCKHLGAYTHPRTPKPYLVKRGIF